MEPILRIMLRFELPYKVSILPVCPPFAPPRCEPIDIRPNFCSPLFRNVPHCPLPLIPSLRLELPQGCLAPQVPRFRKKALTSHSGEVFYQFLQLRFPFWNGGHYILKWNRNIVLPNFRHCATTPIRPKVESQQSNY